MGHEKDNGEGIVDEFDESEDISEDDRVLMVGEDGKEVTMVILAVAEHEGQDYALLAPEEQVIDEEGEEMELFIFKLDCDDEGLETYSPIDDEAVFEQLRDIFNEIMDTGELPEGEEDDEEA